MADTTGIAKAKSGFHHTEETKRKLSELRKGAANPFFGRKHTTEFKAALSARSKVWNASRQFDIGPLRFPPLSATAAAYLAGIVDGEGSISLLTARKGPSISVCNTSVELMNWLKATSGKKNIYRREIPKTAKVQARCPIYVWQIYGVRDILYVIDAIRPFLTIKAERADQVKAQILARYGERLNGIDN